METCCKCFTKHFSGTVLIGMKFSSNESAYKAYRKYGGNYGFDVRRQRTSRKNQKLVKIVYVCSKEGLDKNLRSRNHFHYRPQGVFVLLTTMCVNNNIQ